ncbi:uncharacterized protein LOC120599729 isoform X2 [Pteropus medius]|uniref:uncharacterized protein LOC120599729 isoform X2 n=1 Tax=Pteropus vampyrus TaxID=132908 RepID=UPI00196B081C|nr:uncharacterized protein LOC120599729 isoform X2 [Pteropus giganteus]
MGGGHWHRPPLGAQRMRPEAVGGSPRAGTNTPHSGQAAVSSESGTPSAPQASSSDSEGDVWNQLPCHPRILGQDHGSPLPSRGHFEAPLLKVSGGSGSRRHSANTRPDRLNSELAGKVTKEERGCACEPVWRRDAKAAAAGTVSPRRLESRTRAVLISAQLGFPNERNEREGAGLSPVCSTDVCHPTGNERLFPFLQVPTSAPECSRRLCGPRGGLGREGWDRQETPVANKCPGTAATAGLGTTP